VKPELRAELERLKREHAFDLTDALAFFGEERDTSDYGSAARAHLQVDGELEFDDPLVVSRGDDDGAYVMGWVWVPNELLCSAQSK